MGWVWGDMGVIWGGYGVIWGGYGAVMGHSRDLFKQALDGCPPKYAKSKGCYWGVIGVLLGCY